MSKDTHLLINMPECACEPAAHTHLDGAEMGREIISECCEQRERGVGGWRKREGIAASIGIAGYRGVSGRISGRIYISPDRASVPAAVKT